LHTTGLTKRLYTSSAQSRRNPSTQYIPGAWFWRDALLATMPSSSMHAPMLVKNAFKRSYHSADWKVNMPVPILLGEQETDEWTALVVVTKTTGKCHEAYISTSVALTAITHSIASSVPSRHKWSCYDCLREGGLGSPSRMPSIWIGANPLVPERSSHQLPSILDACGCYVSSGD